MDSTAVHPSNGRRLRTHGANASTKSPCGLCNGAVAPCGTPGPARRHAARNGNEGGLKTSPQCNATGCGGRDAAPRRPTPKSHAPPVKTSLKHQKQQPSGMQGPAKTRGALTVVDLLYCIRLNGNFPILVEGVGDLATPAAMQVRLDFKVVQEDGQLQVVGTWQSVALKDSPKMRFSARRAGGYDVVRAVHVILLLRVAAMCRCCGGGSEGSVLLCSLVPCPLWCRVCLVLVWVVLWVLLVFFV